LRSFKCSERSIWPGAREIEIVGELDLAVSGRLRSALERAASKEENVLVDLSGCEFIDASGLAVLVEAHGKLRARQRQLLLYGVGGQVRRLLAVTGLADGREGSTVAPLSWPRADRPRPVIPDRVRIRDASLPAPPQEVAASGSGSSL
jgi:anti-sigma B factor antagonist